MALSFTTTAGVAGLGQFVLVKLPLAGASCQSVKLTELIYMHCAPFFSYYAAACKTSFRMSTPSGKDNTKRMSAGATTTSLSCEFSVPNALRPKLTLSFSEGL